MPDTQNTPESARTSRRIGVRVRSYPNPVPQNGTLPQSSKPALGTKQGTDESDDRVSVSLLKDEWAWAQPQAENANMRGTHENSWGEATGDWTPNTRDTHDSSRGARSQGRTEAQKMLHSFKVGAVICLVLGNLILLGNVVELTHQVEVLKTGSGVSLPK